MNKLVTSCQFALLSLFGVACGGSSEDVFSGSGGTSGSSATTTGGSANNSGSTGKGGSPGTGGLSSGSGGTSSGGRPGSGGESAGGETAGGNAGATSAGGDAGSGGSAGASAGASNAGAGGAGGPNCPDVFGNYTIIDVDGACGDLKQDAAQRIDGGAVACAFHFVSEGAINGGGLVEPDGGFSGAKLYMGSAQRNPCRGTWNAREAIMTVACGGDSDRCTVKLERQ